MALEAVVFPQEHLSCAAAMYEAPPSSLGCGVDMDEFEENGGVVLQEEAGVAVHGGGGGGAGGMMSVWVNAATCARSIAASGAVEEFWDERQYPVSSPPAAPTPAASGGGGGHAKAAARRRRRRPKVVKNKEEAESQRRNHIAVERNRRRQMNEYLAVLRSLMPPSYAQRVRIRDTLSRTISTVSSSLRLVVPVCAMHGRTAWHSPHRLALSPQHFTVTDVKSPPWPYAYGAQRALWLHLSRNLWRDLVWSCTRVPPPLRRTSKAAPSCVCVAPMHAKLMIDRTWCLLLQGDQASIVAGAINFVKELEQLLQSLEAQKRRAEHAPPAPPFAGFFTFPQYSTTVGDNNAAGSGAGDGEGGCGARPGAADIEVAMAESHANVRVLAPRRPRQLLRMVVALQCLGLTVLHLNVTTTADHLALYSFSLKVCMPNQAVLSRATDLQ
jgi:hypothetical protein